MKEEKVNAASYDAQPTRYILVDGHSAGAPSCPFGNIRQLVGYDTKDKVYVRFTKSVYQRLRNQILVAPVLNTDVTIENNL